MILDLSQKNLIKLTKDKKGDVKLFIKDNNIKFKEIDEYGVCIGD